MQIWQRWSMSWISCLTKVKQLPKHPLIHVRYARKILNITRRSCKYLAVPISRKEMLITWHEMKQSQQPHHCIVWQWRFYPICKTCKKWKMILSSSMEMYSVMHDIHDARVVSMELGWVALYWYATQKYSNQLTLEQWAFENGLPVFWYALYKMFCYIRSLYIEFSLYYKTLRNVVNENDVHVNEDVPTYSCNEW